MLIAGLILVITMPFSGVGALRLVFQLRVNNLVPMLVLTLRSVLWTIAVVMIYWRGGGMIALAIALSANDGDRLDRADSGREQTGRAPTRGLARAARAAAPRIAADRHLGPADRRLRPHRPADRLPDRSVARRPDLYGSVYNLLEQAQFVPISILTTLAPIIAASWPGDRERLLRTVGRASELMATASFGALAFAAVAATPLVRLFFGRAFLAAAPALPVLGGAFVFICFSYLNDNLLVVLGLQQAASADRVLALAVNVAGNLILVPIVGFMGAAWMTLATEAVVLAASVRLILKALDLPLPRPGRVGRTLLAAVLLRGRARVGEPRERIAAGARDHGLHLLPSAAVRPARVERRRSASLTSRQ